MKGHRAPTREVLLVMLSLASWTALAKEIPRPGAGLIYMDVTGHEWCVTVKSTDMGINRQPWAWFTVDADPRRIGHVPVADFVASCGSGGAIEVDRVAGPPAEELLP